MSYEILMKDGTSQKSRTMKSLDRDYFQPEERGLADWLGFVRKLASLIKYDDGSGVPGATWESFIDWDSVQLDPEDIQRYLNDPAFLEKEPEKKRWLSRPHFVLLVTFLKLLEHPQKAINGFTKRHLDFYYREFLQFKNQAFEPDKVHVSITLEQGVKNFVFNKGTRLKAGKGTGGEDIYFEATRDFFLNNGRITDLKSVFLDKETLGLAAIRTKYKDVASLDFGFWPILLVALDVQDIGYILPDDISMTDDDVKWLDSLVGLTDTLNAVTDQMKLTIGEFKTLFATKMSADNEDNAAWNIVDYLLSKAGQTKKGNEQFVIEGTTRENFDDQLKTAIGMVELPSRFNNLDEYYQWIDNREHDFALPIEDVGFVMGIRDKLLDSKDVEEDMWQKVFVLLETTYAQRKIAIRKENLRHIRSTEGFDSMLAFALGDPTNCNTLPAYSNTLEEIYADIQNSRHQAYLQDELFLSVKDFETLMEFKRGNGAKELLAYDILERAMRRKGGITLEKPAIDIWYNLYKSEDASLIRASIDSAGWKPFGTTGNGQAIDMGLVLTSPVLALAEGKRTIEISLFCDRGRFYEKIAESFSDKVSPPFTIQLSGEKEFFTVPSGKVELLFGKYPERKATGEYEEYQVIIARITLEENDPVVASVNNTQEDPAVRIIFNSKADGQKSKIPYTLFRDMRLVKAFITVTVVGIKKIILENDNGEINPKKPFEPFGTQPLAGSRFYFANNEIVSKKLDTLSLDFDWMGMPANFSTYYDNYPEAKGKEFTAKLQIHNNHREFLVNENVNLFSARNKNDVAENLKNTYGNIYTGSDTLLRAGESVVESDRYFLLELNAPDFQHTSYPALVSQRSIEFTKQLQAGSETIKPEDFYVNPPYTPLVKNLTIGYTSHVTLDLKGEGEGSVFYLHPFGVEELMDGSPKNFLPFYDDVGSLLIGIDSFEAPDVISLYFQFLDGSAHPDVSKPDVGYSYLTDKGWSQLDKANIISDTTENLSKSGIVQLRIPENASMHTRIMPDDRYWIKVSVATNSFGIHDLQGVFAQGVESDMPATSRQRHVLMPETITSTADNIRAIKSIHQPFASFGGRFGEDDSFFYTRISERLRHKHRAISSWDYERLILHKFPAIYKAKALPVSRGSQEVKIVVIPDLTQENGMNPFEPRLSQIYLEKVKNYLLRYSSPFAKIQVVSPRYLKVKIRVSIRLNPGFNESYSRLSINKALQRYLSPWAFEGGDIVFGGKIYANTIVNFLENQESVAYVLGLKFFTSDDGSQYTYVSPQLDNVNQVAASSPETILVSADQHDIDIVETDKIDYDDLSGIGYMKIQLDFKVG